MVSSRQVQLDGSKGMSSETTPERGQGKASAVVAGSMKMRQGMDVHLKDENKLTLKLYI